MTDRATGLVLRSFGGNDRATADALSGHLGDLGTVTSVVADAGGAARRSIVDAAGEFGNGTASATTAWSSSGQMDTSE